MTEDQKKILSLFESRVRQLMMMYEKLKKENITLVEEISDKNDEIKSLQEEIRSMNLKYENLKIARVVSIRQDEIHGAKERLSKLVQEVDKCIALLNE